MGEWTNYVIGLLFTCGVILFLWVYYDKILRVIKAFWSEHTDLSEATRKQSTELQKARIEQGNANKVVRDVLIFIGVMSFIVAFLTIGLTSIIGTSILKNADARTSANFNTDIDMKFDGYFTKKITRSVVQLDPDCRDTFDYFKYPYKNKTFEVIESLERINDDGWTEYHRECFGDKEFLRHDWFVNRFGGALNKSNVSSYQKEDLIAELKERIGEATACNRTVILYKKNLQDCEREIIEVETPRMFIPTNLTVNGISVSGNGSGDMENLVGWSILSTVLTDHLGSGWS